MALTGIIYHKISLISHYFRPLTEYLLQATQQTRINFFDDSHFLKLHEMLLDVLILLLYVYPADIPILA